MHTTLPSNPSGFSDHPTTLNRQLDLQSGSVMFHTATMQDVKNMGKEILELTTEVAIEIDSVEASVIDGFILRFPYVARDIFKELNNESLTTCRTVSRLWCNYLDDQKFCWVRMIQRYQKNMGNAYQQWKKVFKNTPIEFAKEISVFTQQFFTSSFLQPDASRIASRIEFHWSPLHIAVGQGNLDLCKYIFEKIKNTQPRIEYEWTALHEAASLGHEEICEFLMVNLEDKNPCDQNGRTPFHYAAERGYTNVCRLIIENVDDKNPAATNGCTPLHLATKNDFLEIARLIVKTGVDTTSLFDGKTAFDIVKERRIKSIFASRNTYAFYKLLSKDKLQLCQQFFEDMIGCLPIFFILVVVCCAVMSVTLKFYYASTCEFDCSNESLEKLFFNEYVTMGMLISLATAFFLTVMTRVGILFCS